MQKDSQMHKQTLDDDGLDPFDEVEHTGIRQQFESMRLVWSAYQDLNT